MHTPESLLSGMVDLNHVLTRHSVLTDRSTVQVVAGRGNEQSAAPLPGESMPREAIQNLRKGTPFTFVEADQILRRYSTLDATGTDGIAVEDCCFMQEFTACPFAGHVIRHHRDPETKRILPRNFMKICAALCRRTPALTKKQLLFDMFDVDQQKILTHDAMFKIYKLLFSNAISDDHILALVFSALRHPNLSHDDEVTRDEFAEMIPDNEIQERLSIDFAFDPSLQYVGEEEEDEEEEEDNDEGEPDNA